MVGMVWPELASWEATLGSSLFWCGFYNWMSFVIPTTLQNVLGAFTWHCMSTFTWYHMYAFVWHYMSTFTWHSLDAFIWYYTGSFIWHCMGSLTWQHFMWHHHNSIYVVLVCSSQSSPPVGPGLNTSSVERRSSWMQQHTGHLSVLSFRLKGSASTDHSSVFCPMSTWVFHFYMFVDKFFKKY